MAGRPDGRFPSDGRPDGRDGMLGSDGRPDGQARRQARQRRQARRQGRQRTAGPTGATGRPDGSEGRPDGSEGSARERRQARQRRHARQGRHARHGRQRRHLRQGRQAEPLQAHGPRVVRGRIEHHRPVGCALCDARLDGRRARVPARARGGSALCTCARRGQRRCRRSRRRRSAGLQQGGPAAGPAAAWPPCCDPGRPGDPGSPQRIGTMSSAADRWTAGVTEGGSAVVIGRSPSSGVACSGAAGHQGRRSRHQSSALV